MYCNIRGYNVIARVLEGNERLYEGVRGSEKV